MSGSVVSGSVVSGSVVSGSVVSGSVVSGSVKSGSVKSRSVKSRLVPKVVDGWCRRWSGRFWRLFPHLLLCSSLVGYAALGALVFQYIEGGRESGTEEDYRCFLDHIVSTVQTLSGNSSSQSFIVQQVEQQVRADFRSVWLQRPERWDFFGSMFFCCTVFTTVGYGEIYPVTLSGKVVCVLYAMVGIPLMLLVILDVGDFLAVLMSRAYLRLHGLCKTLCSGSLSGPRSGCRSGSRALDDGTLVCGRDVVIREPLDIRRVLQGQEDVRHKSKQLQDHKEIFEKILARENLLRTVPLVRSLSCPELNRLPPPPTGHVIWDFTGLGDGMEMLDVPLVLILLVVMGFIALMGKILPIWEKEFRGFDPFYFSFITLTTIGFGDLVPNHPKFFMLTSFFIVAGMAIMSMAFKLSQTRIVGCYRQFIKFLSRGYAEILNPQRSLTRRDPGPTETLNP